MWKPLASYQDFASTSNNKVSNPPQTSCGHRTYKMEDNDALLNRDNFTLNASPTGL